MVVRRAEMLPIECIVRGYLSGSAWAEYQRSQTHARQALPGGLRQSERLPEPVFTPSTKAATGHDENISFAAAVDAVGYELAEEARRISLAAYRQGAELAAARGIIIADTKFELGVIDGRLAICDEVLTPDSSRFWPADQWEPGRTPPAFDKQPLRDWLEATGLGQDAAPAGVACRRGASHPGSLRGGLRATDGLTFAAWPGADGAHEALRDADEGGVAMAGRRRPERRRMTRFAVLVEVALRPGIADPARRHHRAGLAGVGIRRHLGSAGREGVPIRGGCRRRGFGSVGGRGPLQPIAGQPGDRVLRR